MQDAKYRFIMGIRSQERKESSMYFSKVKSFPADTATRRKKYIIYSICLVLAVIMLSTSSMIGAVGINRYTVNNGDTSLEIYSISTEPGEILSQAGVILTEDDAVYMEGNTITVEHFFPVFFNMGDESRQVKMSRGTVSDALLKANIELTDELGCSLPLDTVLDDTVFIDVAVVEYQEVPVVETLSFEYDIEYTESMYAGNEVITKEGSNGEQTVTYSVKYVNGKEIERVPVKTEVTKAAVNGKKVIGTKAAFNGKKPSAAAIAAIANGHTESGLKGVMTSNDIATISTLTPKTPIELDANGVPVNAKFSKVIQATAYHEDHGGTATGVRAQPGYIAVDPNIIPYGTKMYIVSTDGKYTYGYAVAADTGGFIKSRPTNVDLNFSTEEACRAFGRRNVIIYFL